VRLEFDGAIRGKGMFDKVARNGSVLQCIAVCCSVLRLEFAGAIRGKGMPDQGALNGIESNIIFV